jgi:glycerophosphoryl diester phosphodiesterase
VLHPYFDLATPISIAHRGCAGEAPENTIPAFERAIAQGADILETDVHLSRDGIPVLIHDEIVDRVTNAAGRVDEWTAAQLQQLDAGYRFSPDDGKSHPYRDQDVRIPTLEEAFRRFPDRRFNLELKAHGSRLIDASLDLVSISGREALTLLTAGEDAIMAALRGPLQRHPKTIAQGACKADIRAFLGCMAAGTAPPAGPMALQIPPDIGGQPLVTEPLIAYAHKYQIQVHAWTINDPVEMERLLDLGVDGIITDYPARLAEVIRDRAEAR